MGGLPARLPRERPGLGLAPLLLFVEHHSGRRASFRCREGRVEKRTNESDLGGTMRLGSQRCPVKAGTLAHRIYGAEVNERHRHRYEVNNTYVPKLEESGLIISARTPNESLPEMMELPASMHPWFFGVQFHPEFTSTPRDGHPLFSAFINAALVHQNAALKQVA